MRYVKYTNSPKVDDTVIFDLETYTNEGVIKNPFVVEKVTIYYVEKNVHYNDRVLQNKFYQPALEAEYENLQKRVQQEPSKFNIDSLNQLNNRLEETAKVNKIYYSDARIVMSTISPIWKSDGEKKIENNEDGRFRFYWLPEGMRQGTYLIRWDWRTEKNSKIRSAEKIFNLGAADSKINSIYHNFVPREKYNFLMDKYMPKMYRVKTRKNDMTPEVLAKFNKSIAQAFLELDDLAVGLIDLLDPNFIPPGFLRVLANQFNLELKSQNVTAWRNQLKHCIPLYKKKGTLEGLKQALDKIGVRLLKLSNLWQVISPYTWTDGFVITKDISESEIIGYLSKAPLDTDEPYFEISIKSSDNNDYFMLPSKIIKLQEVQVPENKIAVIWNGQVVNPAIDLFKGDVIKIRYKYDKIPEDAIPIENYIRNLPLADQRDETIVKYPLKNWNVKLLDEDDQLFNLLIPERHPFSNPVIYGKIRSTFLYSEKVFNMDTYNGSLINSNNPCDLDKDFIDVCNGGQSSKFNVHLEFDQVTDDKIKEAKEVIIDYSPFHAILNNIRVSSRVVDLVLSPIEKINNEIHHKSKSKEKVACGESIYCQIRHKDGKKFSGKIL